MTAAGVAIGLVGPARQRARKLLDARPLRWLPEAGAILVIAAAIGLVIRPYVQKVHGPASPYIAALQRLEGLPIDPGRLYAENTLYWVIWYLGVPALLLGLVGLAMVTRLCLRALITWRDPTGVARAWVLPVAIIGWGLFAVLWQPFTVPDQPWASRQLVPVVLPGLIVLAVWVAAWMIGRAHARGARTGAVAVATACFVVAMAVPAAAITFGIALSQPADPATRLALSGLAFRTTGAGEVAAVEQLCGALPSHSSVVILDKVAARAFAQVVRGTCGVPTRDRHEHRAGEGEHDHRRDRAGGPSSRPARDQGGGTHPVRRGAARDRQPVHPARRAPAHPAAHLDVAGAVHTVDVPAGRDGPRLVIARTGRACEVLRGGLVRGRGSRGGRGA